MHTPSLHRRVVAAGVAAVVVLTVAFDVLVYFSWRSNLLGGLDAELASREQVITAQAGLVEPEELVTRLEDIGISATIQDRSGRTYEAGPRPPADEATMVRETSLPGGMTTTISVPRTEADRALQRLLLAEVVGTVAMAALAFFLLRLVSELALQPLEQMVAAIRRTAAGRRGERLRPDQPHTRLGLVAGAYDEMLDSLEAALQEADAARDHSQRLQARAQKIVDTANDAFVAADSRGSIIGWNSRAEAVFGWTASEALGRSLVETIVPLASRPAHLAGIERYLATGQSRLVGRPVEVLALHRQGHVFPAELTLWVTDDEEQMVFNAFIRDVTERRKAEEEQSQLASIVASSDEAIVGIGLDHRIMTWNRAAERISGYTAEETLGQPMRFLFSPDGRAQLEDLLERQREGVPLMGQESTWLRKDGTAIGVALTVSPICDRSGRTVGASVIARDITEERRMAAALDATLAELSTALTEARSSEARSRRFLADAAHQLRTPVAGIQACAESLLLDTDPAGADELLANLGHETARAGRLIKALLQTARLDQGMVMSCRPCDLRALCEEELDRARALAPELALRVTSRDWDERKIDIDADVVREILANLIDNARRHARSTIEVLLTGAGGFVEVSVTDDGPGLPPELRDRAFDRFVSLDGRGGTGLGLAIARGLAEAHGGILSYDGNAFVVRVPVTPSSGNGHGGAQHQMLAEPGERPVR
jgi:PAS domain S-box-containing protein